MTTNKLGSKTPGSILLRSGCGAAVLTAALLMSGCAILGLGGKSGNSLSTSPQLPSAEGNVKYSITKNDNTRIILTVKHLANPEKLTPPAAAYVAWTRATNGAPAQNIGALKVDENLDGELDTETPLHSFELFITAEGSGQVQQPSEQKLLWTNYSR